LTKPQTLRPPEANVNKSYSGKAADIWLCGAVLYHMLTGKLYNIKSGYIKYFILSRLNDLDLSNLDQNFMDLLFNLLSDDPEKRHTIKTLKVKNNMSLIYFYFLFPLSPNLINDKNRKILGLL
jgi:serine/threonine protein kinase